MKKEIIKTLMNSWAIAYNQGFLDGVNLDRPEDNQATEEDFKDVLEEARKETEKNILEKFKWLIDK